MASTNGVESASVSNPTPLTKYTPTTTEDDTESIFTLVNQLDFSIKEEAKEQFFNELECVLENEYEKDNAETNHSGLINFFIKHTDPNGKISA